MVRRLCINMPRFRMSSTCLSIILEYGNVNFQAVTELQMKSRSLTLNLPSVISPSIISPVPLSEALQLQRVLQIVSQPMPDNQMMLLD